MLIIIRWKEEKDEEKLETFIIVFHFRFLIFLRKKWNVFVKGKMTYFYIFALKVAF